jgi:RND family efflux transporter MFP subunit
MRTTSILALAALSFAGCGGAAEEEAPPVTRLAAPNAYTVTEDSVASTVAVEGTIQARLRAEISTRLVARVTEVPVDLGSSVRAGQVLIRLGVEDIEVNRAKAAAAVTVSQASRDEAARQAVRMDTLLAADAVARVQRDQAYLALAQAESQLAMADAAMREVETAAGYARIEAPFDGVVASRTVDPGDVASPGLPLLTIESAGEREAVLAVAPEVAAGLTEGAFIEIVGRDGRAAQGTIRAIAGGADAATRTVEVRVRVPEDWPTGTSVTAYIPTGSRVAVLIPAGSVVRRGHLTGVHVVEGDVVLLRWVRLGRAVGDRIEILSGLEVGEQIAP